MLGAILVEILLEIVCEITVGFLHWLFENTVLSAVCFLCKLRQPNKDLSPSEYFKTILDKEE